MYRQFETIPTKVLLRSPSLLLVAVRIEICCSALCFCHLPTNRCEVFSTERRSSTGISDSCRIEGNVSSESPTREVRASNFVEQRLIGTPGSCPRERIAMTLMLPLDSMFLLMESREHPMHVGGLSLFVPPEGDDGEFARSLYRSLTDVDSIRPLFRRKPVRRTSRRCVGTEDADVDSNITSGCSRCPSRVESASCSS